MRHLRRVSCLAEGRCFSRRLVLHVCRHLHILNIFHFCDLRLLREGFFQCLLLSSDLFGFHGRDRARFFSFKSVFLNYLFKFRVVHLRLELLCRRIRTKLLEQLLINWLRNQVLNAAFYLTLPTRYFLIKVCEGLTLCKLGL